MVLVQNFKYACYVFCVVSVVWSIRFSGFFMVFNLWIGTGFILSHVVYFNFPIAIFLLLPMGYICSQVHILTSYCACDAQWLRIAQSKGYTSLHTSLPENSNKAGFQNVVGL